MLCAAEGRAATLVVDPNGTGDFTAIQPAIDAAQAGDTVLVKAGEYVIAEPISFKGKAITVRSESGAETTVIRMADKPANPNRASVVVFESGETVTTSLDGFRLTGGKTRTAGGGGGVYCSGSFPTLTNCTISGNLEGAVDCYGSPSPTLTNCIVWGNPYGMIVAGNPIVSYSCVESVEVWRGTGNIQVDQQFWGWDASRVWVDARA